MKKRRNYLGIILLMGIWIILYGCHGGSVVIGDSRPPPPGPPAYEKGPPPWAPAHGYRAKYQYRYYPSSYVYYDTGRGLYFYYEGDNWRVGVSLPSHIHIDVGDYVTLDMDTDRPYTYHSDVAHRYPPGQSKKGGKGKGKNK